jgi:hypothetical protein
LIAKLWPETLEVERWNRPGSTGVLSVRATLHAVFVISVRESS